MLLLWALFDLAAAAPGAWAASDHASGGELVQVGQDEAILLSVNAETAADMTSVDILMPAGFSPDRKYALDARGGGVGGVFITWHAQFSASGQQLVASGPGVADGGAVLVNFSGTASKVGTLSFVTVTHAADGTSVRWDGPSSSAHPSALVYVVKSLASPQLTPGPGTGPGPGTSGPSHPPWWAIAVAVVGGVALVGCVVTGRQRRGGGRIPKKVVDSGAR